MKQAKYKKLSLDTNTYNKLSEIATKNGLSRSAMVRLLINCGNYNISNLNELNTAISRNRALSSLMLLAEIFTDGHFTIMKFTTNYRIGLGTVNTRADIDKMIEGESIVDCLNNLNKSKMPLPII